MPGQLSNLVLRFSHFLHAPTQNPQHLEKSTNCCDPQAGKDIGRLKELSPYGISLLHILQDFERLIYTPFEPVTHPLLAQEQPSFDTGGQP